MLELERVVPEAVGISSRDVHAFLERMIASGSELHGMMILRQGKVAAEGWWAPFAPGQVHGSQSLTKTWTGTAFGAAMQEGLVTLDTRLIDIFPEYAPLTKGRPYWDRLTMRHMTTMSAGMESQPKITDEDWLREFFTMDIVHEPGTVFYYNSAACSMVGAAVTKLSGLSLRAYLGRRVLSKIGVDEAHLKWHCHPDGRQNGSGGLVSSTEDNARVMDLYRRGGQWEGEQLLSPEWVRFALHTQNDHLDKPAEELSYGGMMWRHGDCMMADGAMGQWGMYFAKKDLVISLSQTLSSGAQNDAMMDAIFDFYRKLSPSADALPEEPDAAQRLRRALSVLALPAPRHRENPQGLARLTGRKLHITGGKVHFYADDLAIFNAAYEIDVSGFAFDVQDGQLRLTVFGAAGEQQAMVGMKGLRLISCLPSANPACTLALSGAFEDERTLALEIRWLESCRVHRMTFHFTDEGATIVSSRDKVGGFDVDDETARAVWMD